MNLNTHADKSIPWWINTKMKLVEWSKPVTAKHVKSMLAHTHDGCPIKIDVNGVLHDVAGVNRVTTYPGSPIQIVLVASASPAAETKPSVWDAATTNWVNPNETEPN